MANKQFTNHAQKELNKNPNVIKCSPSKIIFTEEFALKVVDALKQGEDPFKVFEENGLSVRVLGKSRINGIVSLYKSRYELENLPRRKKEVKPKPHVETAAERRERNLKEAIAYCDSLISNPEKELGLSVDSNKDLIHFSAFKKTFENKDLKVIIKDLCKHYGYEYSSYYLYLQAIKPKEDEFVNILNPHRKK